MSKRRGGSQTRNFTPNYNSFESRSQMRSNWNTLYTVEKIFWRDIRYYACTFKKDLIWERYEHSKFWDNKNLDFRIPCLKLSLLSSLYHFHSTCTNRPIFLVVQVDLILNFRLWICPSPILELQHALLPLKCCELESVSQLFSSSVALF
jgi:hypothetical protein